MNKNIQPYNHNHYPQISTIYKLLILIFSIIYSFTLLFWGSSGDIFYWLNRGIFYKEEPLTALSIWIIKIWTQYTEKSVISLRILGWLTCTISICIPYFTLQKKNFQIKNLHLLAFGIILFANGTFKLFNPDTTTVFCLSCIVTLLLLYYRKGHIGFLYLIAIFEGISIACRFPNIIIILIVPTLLIYQSYRTKKYTPLMHIFLSAIIAIVTYLLLMNFLCESDNIINLILQKVQNPTEGVKSHNLKYIITNYKDSFVAQMGYISTIAIIIYIFNIIYKKLKNKYIAFVLCIIFFLMLRSIITYNASYLFASTVILFLTHILFQTFYSKNIYSPIIQYILTFIGLALVAIAGSDTGIIKIYPFVSIITPLLFFNFYYKYKPSFFHKILFITFLIFTIYQNVRENFSCKATTSYPALKCIHISQNDKTYWEDLLHNIKQYPNFPLILYGVQGHALYSITNEDPLYHYSFWMYKNDKQELNCIFNTLKNYSRCLFIDLRKNDSKFFKEKAKQFNLTLINSNNSYNIYIMRKE